MANLCAGLLGDKNRQGHAEWIDKDILNTTAIGFSRRWCSDEIIGSKSAFQHSKSSPERQIQFDFSHLLRELLDI